MTNHRDDDMRERAVSFLRRLHSLARRDAVDEQVERLCDPEAEERQLQLIHQRMREDEGDESFAPDSGEPQRSGDKIVSIGARLAAKGAANAAQAQPSNIANDDFERDYGLAAGGGDEAAGWTQTRYVLRLPDLALPVFVNPDEDCCVFVPAQECGPGWSGLRLGGFNFDFVAASDPKWMGVEGCMEETLRKAAGGGWEIDATPV